MTIAPIILWVSLLSISHSFARTITVVSEAQGLMKCSSDRKACSLIINYKSTNEDMITLLDGKNKGNYYVPRLHRLQVKVYGHFVEKKDSKQFAVFGLTPATVQDNFWPTKKFQ